MRVLLGWIWLHVGLVLGQVPSTPSAHPAEAPAAAALPVTPTPVDPMDSSDGPPRTSEAALDEWWVVDRIIGRAIAVDGSFPPMDLSVRVFCGTAEYRGALVKSTGHFEIRPEPHPDLVSTLKRNSAADSADKVRSAIARGVRVQVDDRQGMVPCYLSVQKPEYRQSMVLVGLLAPDDTTILARRPLANAGLLVVRRFDRPGAGLASRSTALAPPGARKAYERAVSILDRPSPDFERAIPHLEAAVEAYPAFAAAWDLLGDARLSTGDEGGGLQALTRAVNADPTYLSPYATMTSIISANRNWVELAWLSERFLEASPDAPLGLYIGAAAALRLDDLPLLELRASRLEELGEMPHWPRTEMFRGRIHESRAEYEKAADAYRTVLQTEIDEGLRSILRHKLEGWSALHLIEPRQIKSQLDDSAPTTGRNRPDGAQRQPDPVLPAAAPSP